MDSITCKGAKALDKRLKALQLCVSTDKDRAVLHGIYIDEVITSINNFEVRLVSTDGHLILVQNIKASTKVWGEVGLTPAMLKPETIICKGISWSIIEGIYPTWRNVIPKSFTNRHRNLPVFAFDTLARVDKIQKLLDAHEKGAVAFARPVHWNKPTNATIWNVGFGGYLLVMPLRDKEEGYEREPKSSFTAEGNYYDLTPGHTSEVIAE